MKRTSRCLQAFREEPVGERLWRRCIEPVLEQRKGKPDGNFRRESAVKVTVSDSLRRVQGNLNLGGNADFIRPKYTKVYLGLFYFRKEILS